MWHRIRRSPQFGDQPQDLGEQHPRHGDQVGDDEADARNKLARTPLDFSLVRLR
ncbi:hypothetical protein [Mesorhizobium sanjuanii]|uniref:hypothetical protein n=1 Tax=Mesorhizobium sanjuanii TaxID=2037900 RepID=UPI0013FE3F8E|nr:hypothetical protein [Mesorhizobium sanjuanii]